MVRNILTALSCVGLLYAQSEAGSKAPPTGEAIKQGHSHYGSAFDEGPRTRPYEIKNIGSAPFPITTSNPEVQKWFNQGNTLLHHFWDFEAERSFRWALKMEPDNPMLYWGLARAVGGERSQEFIREAAKRKHRASDREKLYIEALEKQMLTDTLRDRGDNYERRDREYRKVMETLAVKYPDDLEAKLLLALSTMGSARYGTEQIIREVLAKNPNHPGAHHYRIHNWNYHEPEQALESCRRYGALASGSGHALHMPGHVYATVGMWNEAAISMDAATRLEKRNMREKLTFPYNHWNYGHNRNYLSYIQEQLGMANAAIFGARQMIDAPLDPERNGDSPRSTHSQGISAMMRALIKFERWGELLDARTFPWRDLPMDRINKAYVEARAHLGQQNLDKAARAVEAHALLSKELEKAKFYQETFDIQSKELKARLALAKGDTLRGLALLSEAADLQFEQQRVDNDPPTYPELLYLALGRVYLTSASPGLAVQAFEKALSISRNDIFALSGLVEAHHALGQKEKARDAMARLLFQASDADKGLKIVERAQATGIRAEPRDSSPASQRNYAKFQLDTFGPTAWEPFTAPKLEARDADNAPVSLEQYRGKNVLLVFYLGRECPHCLKQLQNIEAKKGEWERLNTVVLAVSANPPAQNKDLLKGGKYTAVRFLSDSSDHANAHRFQTYDDFEDMELHSTMLVDKKGRLHWAHTGGAPFENITFLTKQVERIDKAVELAPKEASGGGV